MEQTKPTGPPKPQGCVGGTTAGGTAADSTPLQMHETGTRGDPDVLTAHVLQLPSQGRASGAQTHAMYPRALLKPIKVL
jgi:hypothetical protein